MKMYMPLTTTESGTVQHIKQAGTTLSPGSIIGILTLDDPARVKHAKPFEGFLPPLGTPSITSNKPHQQLARYVGVLEDILDGFDNQGIMKDTVKSMIEVLHDPELPYSEVSSVLASLAGRMPAKLEESVRSIIDAAKTKGKKGDITEFPAGRVKKMVESYISTSVLAPDRPAFRAQLGPLLDVIERFANGLKGHEMHVISSLLERYDSSEKVFSSGAGIEARVLALRDEYKDDLDKVVALVLSHIKVAGKVKMVLALLDYVKNSGLSLIGEGRLKKVMQGLASLESKYAFHP